MNLIIIPSLIRCINKSLSYSDTRSEYSPHERYEQLLKTIASVKEKIPNPYIVLLECSKDIEEYEKILISNVNEYINYYHTNPEVISAVESIYKGYGESLTLYTFLKKHFQGKNTNDNHDKIYYDKIDNRYENIFKISGRYFLNTRFNYNKFNNDNNNFRCYTLSNMVTTRLYKIHKKYFDLYITNFIPLIYECSRGRSIEDIIATNLPYKHIDYLGVSGYIAVNKNEFIDE